MKKGKEWGRVISFQGYEDCTFGSGLGVACQISSWKTVGWCRYPVTDTGHKHENIKPMTLSLQTQERTFISNEMSGIKTFCLVPVLFSFQRRIWLLFQFAASEEYESRCQDGRAWGEHQSPWWWQHKCFWAAAKKCRACPHHLRERASHSALALITIEKEDHTQLSHSSSQNTKLSSGSLCLPLENSFTVFVRCLPAGSLSVIPEV